MAGRDQLIPFERAVLPHLDAAHNLARWLTGNDLDALEMTQEACLRAFMYFKGFRGDNPRKYLLAHVRRTFHSWQPRNRELQSTGAHLNTVPGGEETVVNVDILNARIGSTEAVRHAMAALPVELREILVLKEMERFGCEEISELMEMPPEKVKTQLTLARLRLQTELAK